MHRYCRKELGFCRKGIEFKKGEKSGLCTDIAEKNWVFAEKELSLKRVRKTAVATILQKRIKDRAG